MSPQKDGSTIQSTTFWANGAAAANESALARQFVSDGMAAGIAFVTTDTIKCQVLCQESAANDNLNRQPITVKVYSEDGQTLRATLLALAHIGPNTTEWLATGPRNKIVADGDVLTTGYTTVAGDRLVIELGGQASSAGGSTVTGTQWYGANGASDLGENETDTNTALNAWFEISRTITFLDPDFTTQQNQLPEIKPPVTPPIAVGLTVAAGLLLTTLAPTPPTIRAPFYAGRQPLPIVRQVDAPQNLLPLLLGGEAPAPFRQTDWPIAFPIPPTPQREITNLFQSTLRPYNSCPAGPYFATAAVNDASVGDVAWTNPGNAVVSDNVYAEVTLVSQTSHRLNCTGFNFNIAPTKHIINILVEVEASSAGGIATFAARLIRNGVVEPTAAFTVLDTPEAFYSFSSTPLWNATWTPAEINASNFGVSFRQSTATTNTISIDAVRITISCADPIPYYKTDWSAPPPYPAPLPDNPPNLLENTLAPSGDKPFSQSEWPLSPKRPDAFTELATINLPLGMPQQPSGDVPFNQNDWPNLPEILPSKAPQHSSYRLSFGAPDAGIKPFLQNDWPKLQQLPDLYQVLEILNLALGTMPFRQDKWPILPSRERPWIENPPNLLTTTLAEAPGPVPFIPIDWLLLKQKPPLLVFDPLNLTIQLPIGEKPFVQSIWELPAARTLFVPTATDQRLLTLVPPPGPAPFSQSEWPLPPPADKRKLGIFMLTANVVLLTTPPPPVATGSREKRKWRRGSA